MEWFLTGLGSGFGAINVVLLVYVLNRFDKRLDGVEKKIDDVKDRVADLNTTLRVHIAEGHPPDPVAERAMLRAVRD